MTTRTIKRASSMTEQIVARATKTPEETPVQDNVYIPTGSALLNLALSDRADGGYLPGKIANVIGDSSSGKTFQCLTTLAEVAHNPAFDNYLLIHDDAEAASEFDLIRLFGQKTADRILPPSLDREEPRHSRTMMDFQSSIRRLLRGDQPFVYIQDSFDALTTDQELKHAADLQDAHDKGKEAKGTYGMEKAKHASILLRLIAGEIKKTKSLVIIISQTRDNIDPMSFQRKTRAGGKALYFYCSYEMWLAVAKKLSTKVNDRSHIQGVVSRTKITKNKANGKVKEVDLPIYYDLGVDDVGACVDFLIQEKWWVKSGSGIITAPELKTAATRVKLIKAIEEKGWIDRLHSITEKAWLSIEGKLKLDRKRRYD